VFHDQETPTEIKCLIMPRRKNVRRGRKSTRGYRLPHMARPRMPDEGASFRDIPFSGGSHYSKLGAFPEVGFIHTDVVNTITGTQAWNPGSFTNRFILKLNSLENPLGTFDAAKVNDYSTLANIWYFYYVYGGSYDIQMINDTTKDVNVAWFVGQDAGTGSTERQIAQNGKAMLLGSSTSGNNRGRIRGHWKAGDYVATENAQAALTGYFGISPSTAIGLHLAGYTVDGSTSFIIQVIIRLRFNVKLWGRLLVSTSLRDTPLQIDSDPHAGYKEEKSDECVMVTTKELVPLLTEHAPIISQKNHQILQHMIGK